MTRPRILLADDHVPFLERVTALLQSDFDIVGCVNNGTDLVAGSARLQPDVVITDITMPGLTGIEAAHEIRTTGSKAKFIFLSVHEQPAFVRACMAEGAFGYVVKRRLALDLLLAIDETLAGRQFISPSISR